jgi:hypothetical protein
MASKFKSVRGVTATIATIPLEIANPIALPRLATIPLEIANPIALPRLASPGLLGTVFFPQNGSSVVMRPNSTRRSLQNFASPIETLACHDLAHCLVVGNDYHSDDTTAHLFVFAFSPNDGVLVEFFGFALSQHQIHSISSAYFRQFTDNYQT